MASGSAPNKEWVCPSCGNAIPDWDYKTLITDIPCVCGKKMTSDYVSREIKEAGDE